MTDSVYLIDASIYIFRAYFGIPDEWHDSDGRPVNALFGYTQFLLKFLTAARPQHLAVAYDESLGSCFRNEIYPAYKNSRALPDEMLAYQLKACKGLTEIFGISSLASDRYEADDIIATLAHKAQIDGRNIVVVTKDKDLGQLLLKEGDYLWDFGGQRKIDRYAFHGHFGVWPEQLEDYLALVGDSVDDIPGVPGIGKKTASSLLEKFSSIERLYRDSDGVAGSGIRGAATIVSKLKDYRDQVEMAQRLVRLEKNAPLAHDQSLLWQPPSIDVIRNYLDEFGLGQYFQRQLDSCHWWKLDE
ncbi:MAG: 5'-3' exonuclease H3TH domain-containing protein [Oceanicoccus sp.]